MSGQLLSDTRIGATMLPRLRGRGSLVLVLLAAAMFALAIRSSRRGATS